MRIADCMTKDVQIANPDQTIRYAAQTMGRLDAGAMPVGENDRLVGMITDRDIAIRGIARGKGPDAKIREVMSAGIEYCFGDEDAEDVLHKMAELQVRRLPVLNRDKRLIGIVSLGDLAMNGESAGEALSGISQQGGLHSQMH
ncbi:CBS domain-containing protein [Mesorhizobium sp. dw_380]|uniref:CBS domain-containing protein n=1 Tax=Mesorhizobium sp. dw_380 TaxID=2812001 RepID=UPI001BDEA1F3|nr:CBS domain-containing protein [Mesorhizobium sp. dw_380]